MPSYTRGCSCTPYLLKNKVEFEDIKEKFHNNIFTEREMKHDKDINQGFSSLYTEKEIEELKVEPTRIFSIIDEEGEKIADIMPVGYIFQKGVMDRARTHYDFLIMNKKNKTYILFSGVEDHHLSRFETHVMNKYFQDIPFIRLPKKFQLSDEFVLWMLSMIFSNKFEFLDDKYHIHQLLQLKTHERSNAVQCIGETIQNMIEVSTTILKGSKIDFIEYVFHNNLRYNLKMNSSGSIEVNKIDRNRKPYKKRPLIEVKSIILYQQLFDIIPQWKHKFNTESEIWKLEKDKLLFHTLQSILRFLKQGITNNESNHIISGKYQKIVANIEKLESLLN